MTKYTWPRSPVHLICLTTTVACLGTFHKPVPSPFEKLVPSRDHVCSVTARRRCGSSRAQTRKWAALFPFDPLCYTANVEVGERVRVALLASPNCKTKQKKTGLVIKWTPLSVCCTSVQINKCSRVSDASSFLFSHCVCIGSLQTNSVHTATYCTELCTHANVLRH